MLLRPFVGIIILQQQHFKWKLAAAWSVVHNWLAPCLHTAQRQCSIMLSIDSIIEKITLLKASVNLDWFTRDKELKRFEVRVQFLPPFSIHNGSPLMSKAHLLLIMQRAFECRLLVWSSTLITYLLWNGIHFGEAVICLGFTCSEWILTQRDFFQCSAWLQLSPARVRESRQILACSSSRESGRNHAARCKGAWTTSLRWCDQMPCAVLSGNLLLIHFRVHFMPGLLSSPVISNRPFYLNDNIQGRLVIRVGDGQGICACVPVGGLKESPPMSLYSISWAEHLTSQYSGRLTVVCR